MSSLWNYKDKINHNDINYSALSGKSFEYKTKLVGETRERTPKLGNPDDQSAQQPLPSLNVKVTIPLKHLSNFWRFLDLILINSEVELDLSERKDCVLTEHNNITEVNFMITSTKRYVPVVTLSINDNIKLLQNLNQG